MIKVLFMGRKSVSAKILECLSRSKGVEIVGVLTDSHLVGSPTTQMAKSLNLDLYTLESVNDAISSGKLTFDIGLSVLFWRKINKELIEQAKLGIINFHPAILPDYKGTAGYNVAILQGLLRWGITAHYVDENIDTGGIIEIKTFSIDPESETAQSLESRTMSVLPDFVLEIFYRAIESKALLPVKPNEGGRYISREEMESMKEVVPGDDVDTKIRAFWFPPYKGAFISINGKDYTLVSDELLAELAPAGTTNLFVDSVDD